jgi:hypothetical protein
MTTEYCCDALKACIERWDTIVDDEVPINLRTGESITGHPVLLHLWKLTDSGKISRKTGSRSFAYINFCPFCGTRLRDQGETLVEGG